MLIQKLRLQRGWSQEQLAELSGLSVRTIQRLERGQTASVESLKSLGAVFETDFSNLRDTPMETTLPTAIPTTKGVTAEELLALAHVRKIKGFYIHTAYYVVFILVFGIFNFFHGKPLATLWPALIWGSFLVMHGLRVYDRLPFLSGKWEKQQVEAYLGRRLL